MIDDSYSSLFIGVAFLWHNKSWMENDLAVAPFIHHAGRHPSAFGLFPL